MRIAFVSTILHYPWGGADTLWTHAAERACAQGDAVWFAVSELTAASPRLQALRRAGAHWEPRPVPAPPGGLGPRLLRRLRAPFPATAPLVRALGAFRPDRVVISCGGTGDLVLEPALCAWLRDQRVPYRVICNWQAEHPQLQPADRTALAAIFAAAEALVFVSSRNLAVTRRWLLAPLPQAAVIQNPVRDTPDRQPLPWPAAADFRLATVGRLAPEKGLTLLLHALAEALGAESGWSLDLLGEGPERPQLEAVVAALGLGERVRLPGRVPDLDAIWAGHQLLLSPALDEGVPMTIPEAMLRGRPVLATCVGGAEDWITGGHTGYLCPAPTLPLLAAALRAAWADRARWPEVGRAAAAAARARYRPDDYLALLQPWPPS